MQVDIWSDVVCPWCFIGKRRFEQALSRFPHREQVSIVWRSFELDPTAPPVRPGDPAERLAAKYGMTTDQARAAWGRLTETAAAEGLRYRLDAARSGNTFDAHRVIHLAGRSGLQDAVEEALMNAYLCEGAAIGRHEALVAAAGAAGLDEDEVAAVLDGDAYADAVRADEAEAAARGITGVPFFLLDGRFGVPGAQDPDTLLAVLNRAWERRTDPTPAGPAPARPSPEAVPPRG
ncbi:MAG TPA: DsbA family oxidoreductase [Acidimicrobiales bacterium]|nr:DsbA family oxidoreductase [Acidimicrobiales bacterium]